MTRLDLFRNILCPVDFSEHSRQALRYAALLACRTQARLTAIFVEDPLLVAATRGMTAPATTRTALRRFVERVVASYGVQPGSMRFQVGTGKPSLEIARAAERSGSDLIVMGAHGLTGASKMILGSTTEHVLRRVKVPVLAIPPFKGRASAAPSRGWPDKWSLAAVDLGRRLRNDVATATEVADGLGTLVVLLHVVQPHNRSRLLKARARLEKLRQKLTSSTVVACRVLAGKPDEQIAAAAADADVDLVILTRRRGKGLFGARLGSTSYQVLCEAGTPVLALPSNRNWLRRAPSASDDRARVAG